MTTQPTLTADWVTRAPEGLACDRCLGRENVYTLELISYVARYLCLPCLEEAVTLAKSDDVVWGFGER